MGNFYPKGALKGGEKFKALLVQRHERPTVIYLISVGHQQRGQADVYRTCICSTTKISRLDTDPPFYWVITNEKYQGNLNLKENPQTGYIESAYSGGYVFENIWHAYAYLLHLKQSNLRIDGEFPIAVS